MIVPKNHSAKSKITYAGKMTIMLQKVDKELWKKTVRYVIRSHIESVFSVIKQKFGELIRSRKWEHIVQYITMKFIAYNQSIT
jgi:uncharacterized membrane protein YcfT